MSWKLTFNPHSKDEIKNMKYIKIKKDEIYTSKNVAILDTSTMKWKPSKPELHSCNLKEWFIHAVLRKHFSFGQPYCVVCGYAELKNN